MKTTIHTRLPITTPQNPPIPADCTGLFSKYVEALFKCAVLHESTTRLFSKKKLFSKQKMRGSPQERGNAPRS